MSNKSIKQPRSYPSVVSSFSKGMIQDMAKTLQPKDSYYRALNARIVTDTGQSTLVLTNTLGNKLDVVFPEISSLWEISKNGSAPVGAWSVDLTVTTDAGSLTRTVTGTIGGWEEFFINIKNAFGPTSDFATLGIYCVTSGLTSLRVYKVTGNLLTANTSLYTTSTKILDKQTNLMPIASCTMREDLIVMTRPQATSPTSGLSGQLWKLEYDDINPTNTPTITLLYNGAMDLSTEFPIKRMLGFYENNIIQRVYWTDAFNPLRTLNIADADCAGIPVSLINIIPTSYQERIKIDSIQNGGTLKPGMYQIGYRLIKQGAATSYSRLSNQVHIVSSSETTGVYFDNGDLEEYIGTAPELSTPKSIQFSLENIDTNYDKIEFIIFRHVNLGSEGVVWGPFPISTDNTITKIYTGNESVTTITVEEYNLLSSVDTFGDISTKENYLIAANVSGKQYNDIEFDCRAYRFNPVAEGATTYITDWDTIDIFGTITQAQKDAINPYNVNIDLIPTPSEKYVYQSDGITLGGTGQNLSYKIVAYELDGNTNDLVAPSRSTWLTKTKVTGTITTDTDYTNVATWFDYKSPYVHGTLKGYSRGETYRFGVTFFDKKQRPSFVQWIGDIRFPEAHDLEDITCYKKDGTSYTIRSGELAGSTPNSLYSLGIEFEIDISSIQDEISGFEIVRVERTLSDKTRLGVGLYNGLHPGNVWTDSSTTETAFIASNTYTTLNTALPTKYLTFDCPEHIFGHTLTKKSGDKLFIGPRLKNMEKTEMVFTASAAPATYLDNSMKVFRGDYTTMVYPTDVTPVERIIDEFQYLGKGQKITIDSGDSVYNYSDVPSTDPEDFNPSMGCTTIFMSVDDYIPQEIQRTDRRLATYVRQNLTQYGGADHISRSKNTYIPCDCFIPITDLSSSSQSFKCYGGDTYICQYGFLKGTPNDSITGSIIYDYRTWVIDRGSVTDLRTGNNSPMTLGLIFPCESTFNLDLRKGVHLLSSNYADDFPDFDYYGIEEDQHILEEVYNRQDINRTFIPKPELYNIINSFDNRFYASDPKINGEEVDSWRTFITYKDVEGIHGPVNWIERMGDNIAFFQDRAVGMMAINPRSVVQTAEGQPLELARGSLLHDYQYISQRFGTIHRPAVSPNGVYFFDKYSRKLFKLSLTEGATQVSDVKGLNAFFYENTAGKLLTTDNPLNGTGLAFVYNSRFNELLITFLNDGNNFTLSFSEYTDAFVSLHSFTPAIYITNNHIVLSSFGNDLYRHDSYNYGWFYDQYYNFELDMVVNPYPTETKVFDTFSMHMEVSKNDNGVLKDLDEPISLLRCFTDTQNTDWVAPIQGNLLTRNCYRAEREWKYSIPGSAVINPRMGIFDNGNLDGSATFKERLRDKYMTINLKYLNNDNKRLVLHYLKSNFRLSAR